MRKQPGDWQQWLGGSILTGAWGLGLSTADLHWEPWKSCQNPKALPTSNLPLPEPSQNSENREVHSVEISPLVIQGRAVKAKMPKNGPDTNSIHVKILSSSSWSRWASGGKSLGK